MSKRDTPGQPPRPRDGKNERGLTPRQERFVEAYMLEPNATQAAITAGYAADSAHVTGSKLLANAKVLMAIEERQEERSIRVQYDEDYVIQRLIDNVERCRQAEPVRDMRGRIIEGQFQFNARDANKALELLGKHKGMFVDRTRLEGGIDVSLLKAAEQALDSQLDRFAPKADGRGGNAPGGS